MTVDKLKRLSNAVEFFRRNNSGGGNDDLIREIDVALREKVPQLIAVAEAASSILSEEGVREYLSAYVMGVELIGRLEKLEAD